MTYPTDSIRHGQAPYGGNMGRSQFCQPAHRDNLPAFNTSTHSFDHAWMDVRIDPQLQLLQDSTPNSPWQHQQPIDRYVEEPQRTYFTTRVSPNGSIQSFCPQMNEGVTALPRAPPPIRYSSPVPSQGTYSQPSSAQSPGADQEWYSDQGYSPRPEAMDQTQHFPFPLPSSFPDQKFGPTALTPYNSQPCVSMDQIQSFPDLHGNTYEDNDVYSSLSQAHDAYSRELDQHSHQSRVYSHQSYRHSNDEDLGASVKSSNTPITHHIRLIHGTMDQDSIYPDPDADADAEADIDEQPDETSDTDYTPQSEYAHRSTRTRKRHISNIYPSASSHTQKRHRISKTPQKTGLLVCKDCDHSPFRDNAALQRHINTSHLRAYVCVFAFAGCKSTFASKNEWKRHVASQHLNFSAWVCSLGTCDKMHASRKTGERSVGAEFNRKDLFTQHLRRMHAPFDVKRKKNKNLEWEEEVKRLQTECLVVKRQAPTMLGCPMQNCQQLFEGATCWDERMEHLAKHLEQIARDQRSEEEMHQEDDRFLTEWAVRENIIERRAGKGYRLAGYFTDAASEDDHDEEDADGEDE